jgi:hypothetical protein
MKTQTHPEVLHYHAARPGCESAAAADLFRDLLHLEANKENCGRVLDLHRGRGHWPSGLATQHRRSRLEGLCQSPNFRACYDLSMARLTLQKAILGH